MEARRQANPMTGAIAYPSPSLGYLEQDAELMEAFEILEELQASREEEKERLAKIKEHTQQHFAH
jgi:hypothetical protein